MAADRIAPAAVVAVGGPGNQFVADGGIPFRPVTTARGPHGLGGIVMAVEVVQVVDAMAREGGIRLELVQVLEAALNLRALVNSSAKEGHDAGGGARKRGGAALLHVTKA